jgi:hypothetical protein
VNTGAAYPVGILQRTLSQTGRVYHATTACLLTCSRDPHLPHRLPASCIFAARLTFIPGVTRFREHCRPQPADRQLPPGSSTQHAYVSVQTGFSGLSRHRLGHLDLIARIKCD